MDINKLSSSSYHYYFLLINPLQALLVVAVVILLRIKSVASMLQNQIMSILSKRAIVTAVVGCCITVYASAFVNHRHSSHIPSTFTKHSRSRYQTTIFNSSDYDDSKDSENNGPDTNDPDGIPLFDTNDRATLFGLEPNAEMDPLDNPGLQFTGPLILFMSIYVTLSLFFAGDGELVLFDNIQ